jgi:hypothetical protein
MHKSAWWGRDRLALSAAALAPLSVAVVLVPFRASFPNADAALLLVGVVVAVAANGHRFAGILAAASAAVWFDFFLTMPYERFTITHRDDIETTVLLLLVGGAVTELAVRGRRQRRIAIADAAYLAAIRATTELVSSGQVPVVAVIDQVRVQLVALLGLRSCRFERSFLSSPLRLESDGRLKRADIVWDIDEYGMPDQQIELLVTCNGRSYGRFMLDPTPGAVPPPEARQVSAILASQVGAALAQDPASNRVPGQ